MPLAVRSLWALIYKVNNKALAKSESDKAAESVLNPGSTSKNWKNSLKLKTPNLYCLNISKPINGATAPSISPKLSWSFLKIIIKTVCSFRAFV